MRFFATMFLMLFAAGSFAMAGTIKGLVTDADSNEPLIGANIVVEGTTMGASSDIDGAFVILNVPSGQYTVQVSYLGYQQMEKIVTVTDNGEVSLKMGLQAVALTGKAIDIVASRARIRETPVAFTNMEKEQITESLGSQDIPLALNTTPGVYATAGGGGAGDARINVRGFDQRNTAVMINGVPVNDMENGWVYWSNWDGLGDVTSSIQVQRGLGASNLAISSVGGTLNILTDPASYNAGFSYKQEFGSATFLKETLSLHTGLMDNGFSASAAVVRKNGNGIADQTWTDAWAYFGALSYIANDQHTFELYAIGAPQKHGQRLYQQAIGTFDADYARDVFADEDRLAAASVDEAVTGASNFGRNYNPNWGPINSDLVQNMQVYYNGSTHDFTDRSVFLDGEKVDGFSALMERENYYHKPQFNLNWYWNMSEKALLTNVAYVSFGRGGGTGLKGWPGQISDGQFAGQLDFQSAYEFNSQNINAAFSDSEFNSTTVVRNSVNNHNWYGLLSTLDLRLNDQFKITTGIDLRSYKGEHFRTVRNLLGGDYYLDFDDANQATPVKRLGDKIDYNNDGLTRWAGGFLQLEGRADALTYVISGSASYTGYQRVDYFVDPDAHLDASTNILPTESDWQNFAGGNIKAGANYNVSPAVNVFGNVGFNSKAPIFDAVFDFSHQLYDQTFNEQVLAIELGSGYRNSNVSLSGNVYFTRWNDRSWSTSVNSSSGNPSYFLLQGIDARHMGIEVDGLIRVNDMLDVRAMVSLGDWEWLNDVTTSFAPEDDPTNITEFQVFAAGLKVGDAAQKTFALSPTLRPTEGLFFNATWTGFFDHFADFDPASRTDANDTEQAWKLPAYNLIDLHFGYDLPIEIPGDINLQLFGHVFNLLDSNYITDATDGGAHTADDAEIHFGLQRRFNVGVSIAR